MSATSSSTSSPTSSTATSDVRVVATIRADVFDKPLQDTRIGAAIGAGAFVLAPMTPAQLGDAITLPAARAGVTVDEGGRRRPGHRGRHPARLPPTAAVHARRALRPAQSTVASVPPP